MGNFTAIQLHTYRRRIFEYIFFIKFIILNTYAKGVHYKIASYKLGNMNLLVRRETCCCDGGQNDLPSLLSSIDLNNNDNDIPSKIEGSRLSCVKRGILQYEETVLATKSAHGEVFEFPGVKYSLMFFSQCQNLLVGWHQKGMLKKVERFSYDEVMEQSNKTKQAIHESMSKLTHLLSKLKDFAMSQQEENARYSAIFIGGHDVRRQTDYCLNVYKCNGTNDVIPPKLFAQIYGDTEIERCSDKRPLRDEVVKLANELYG